MAKNLIFIFSFFFMFSCEKNPNIQITNYKLSNEIISIDVVQKNIYLDALIIGPYSNQVKILLKNWLDLGIKLNGFEGEVDIELISISTSEVQLEDGININIDLELKFIIKKKTLKNTKIINFKGNEFGELRGKFSLNDKDILVKNIINKLIDRFIKKISEEIN